MGFRNTLIERVTCPKYLKTMNRLMRDYKRYPEGFVTFKTVFALINGMFSSLIHLSSHMAGFESLMTVVETIQTFMNDKFLEPCEF